jgi:hypothetical protein
MLAVMPGARKRQGALNTAVVLAGAGALAGAALVAVLRNRVALAVILGVSYRDVVAGLLLSVAASAAGLALLALRRRAPPEAWRPRLSLHGALELLVAAAVLYLAALQPYRSVVALACFGLAGGAAALLALDGGLAARHLPRRLVLALDVGLFALCLLAVGGELTLRAVAARSASPLFAQPTESLLDTLARYRLRPDQATADSPVNSLGHLDDEWGPRVPGVPRAATIGDSFSVGVVPHRLHFTTVAEQQLGRGEVCNLGITGIGPDAYLRLLVTEALPLQPDVVIVDLFVGNDLLIESRDAPTRGGLESWLDADRLLLVRIPQRLLTLAREQEGELGELPGPVARTDAGSAAPWLADPLLEPPSFTPEGFARLEQRRAREACRPDAPPDWEALCAVLLEMRRACGTTPFGVLLIPDEFQVEDETWRLASAVPDGERFDRDQPQRVLSRWLAGQGIPCLDLLPALRAVPPMPDGRRHLYHLRDTHFNARGNAVAGRELARFLRPWWV